MSKLQKVGVLAHPYRPGTGPLAEQITASLRSAGVDTWVRTAWNAQGVRSLVKDRDLIIAIGGDGAMLRAARVCAPFAVPLFGLNTGHLGFLAEIGPDDWQMSLQRLLEGDYWLEERMMLSCCVFHEDECVSTEDALNDVVISRGAIARSVRLEAFINDSWTTSYNADGVIVSTPTGSTAYALAVGGPILPPELRNIMILPVAPHLSMDRSLVLPEHSEIKIMVAPRSFDPEVVVTVDGEMAASMNSNDHVIIRAAERVSRFARLREHGYFFRSILDRLEPRLALQRQSTDRD